MLPCKDFNHLKEAREFEAFALIIPSRYSIRAFVFEVPNCYCSGGVGDYVHFQSFCFKSGS